MMIMLDTVSAYGVTSMCLVCHECFNFEQQYQQTYQQTYTLPLPRDILQYLGSQIESLPDEDTVTARPAVISKSLGDVTTLAFMGFKNRIYNGQRWRDRSGMAGFVRADGAQGISFISIDKYIYIYSRS